MPERAFDHYDDNCREAADHQKERDGDCDHLDAVIVSFIFVACGLVQAGKNVDVD
jgi:hypothetical protein